MTLAVDTSYGELLFFPNAPDAPSIGTWLYVLDPDAEKTLALGEGSSVTEIFQLTYITRDDNGNETGRYEADIEVTVFGKDDPIDSISFGTADIFIDENSPIGEMVAKINIDDPDTMVDDSNGNSDLPDLEITTTTYVDENGVTQSLTGDSPFGFDANGNIVVAGALDYETISQYTLTITATDKDGVTTKTAEAVINVRNVNEAPTLMVRDASGTIDENVNPGTKVTTDITFTPNDVDAGDRDDLTYRITGGTGKDIFTINQDGEIRLAPDQSLDYERILRQEGIDSYTLHIVARDLGGLESDPVTVTIEIGDEFEINNNIPYGPITMNENDDSASFTILFDTRPTSSHPNLNIPPNVAITKGNDSRLFTINPQGELTLTRALDYESDQNQYRLTIRVDVGPERDETTLTINVGDVPEVSTISVDEDSITIAENDANADLNTIFEVGGDIVVGLDEGDFTITGEHSEKFRVAKNTNDEWQLELTSALDYEAVRDCATDTEVAFDLLITITDDRGNSATETINITVTDSTTETTPQLGTDIRDHLNGNTNNNYIYGYKGNDEIRGGDGHDTIYGGRWT